MCGSGHYSSPNNSEKYLTTNTYLPSNIAQKAASCLISFIVACFYRFCQKEGPDKKEKGEEIIQFGLEKPYK